MTRLWTIMRGEEFVGLLETRGELLIEPRSLHGGEKPAPVVVATGGWEFKRPAGKAVIAGSEPFPLCDGETIHAHRAA